MKQYQELVDATGHDRRRRRAPDALPGGRILALVLSGVFLIGVAGDQTAPIVIFHHVLADGSAGLTMLAGLMDGAPGRPNSTFS